MKKETIEELIKRKSYTRKQKFEKGVPMRGIRLRQRLHFLVSLILKIDQIASRERIVIIKDERTCSNTKTKIFTCNHIGGNDVQRAFQVIKKPAYLMLGDPGILYKMPIYYGLLLNGVIPLETKDKEERKITYKRATELLNKGGNLLIFPEGAWNVTPNLPVMKTFTGAVRLAQETGSEIVPIAMQQYGKTFLFNIGKNYSISKSTTTSIHNLNGQLRDILCTLSWEIMESVEPFQRSILTENYLDEFQTEIISRCNYGYGFSLQDAISERFHDKNVTEPDEAFLHLKDLHPRKENAFLFRQR